MGFLTSPPVSTLVNALMYITRVHLICAQGKQASHLNKLILHQSRVRANHSGKGHQFLLKLLTHT